MTKLIAHLSHLEAWPQEHANPIKVSFLHTTQAEHGEESSCAASTDSHNIPAQALDGFA